MEYGDLVPSVRVLRYPNNESTKKVHSNKFSYSMECFSSEREGKRLAERLAKICINCQSVSKVLESERSSKIQTIALFAVKPIMQGGLAITYLNPFA